MVPRQRTDRFFALLILCAVVGAPFGVALIWASDQILDFIFFYPLFMSSLWTFGGLYYWLHWERRWPWGDAATPPILTGAPRVSILVPCFNELSDERRVGQEDVGKWRTGWEP